MGENKEMLFIGVGGPYAVVDGSSFRGNPSVRKDELVLHRATTAESAPENEGSVRIQNNLGETALGAPFDEQSASSASSNE